MLQALKRLVPWNNRDHPVAEVIPDWAWTPDQHVLEQYFHQLMFIPDEMMASEDDSEKLKNISCRVINPSVYTSANFFCFQQNVGKDENGNILYRPIIMPGDYKPEGFMRETFPLKVRGELHLVWANKIYLLDKMKLNTVRYVRQRVKILYPWRAVCYNHDRPVPNISHHYAQPVVAWMYIGIPSYWDSRIGGVLAQPMQTFKHDEPQKQWLGEFYDFKNS